MVVMGTAAGMQGQEVKVLARGLQPSVTLHPLPTDYPLFQEKTPCSLHHAASPAAATDQGCPSVLITLPYYTVMLG